jgi:hypothetical protein
MRGSRRWIAFTFAVIAIALCTWTAANWKRFRPYKWQQVESQDAQFRISFPGDAAASKQSMTATEDGSTFLSSRLTSSPAYGVIYALDWWENPAQKDKSTDKLFADFRDCNIKAFHGNIAAEKETEVQGYPAKATLVFAPNRLVVENLVVRVGPRLYSLWVLDSTGRLDMSNIKKFFASLSLHKT